jgi:hypothetical protein
MSATLSQKPRRLPMKSLTESNPLSSFLDRVCQQGQGHDNDRCACSGGVSTCPSPPVESHRHGHWQALREREEGASITTAEFGLSCVRACVCLAPTRRRGTLPGPGRYRPMQICRLIELEAQKGLRASPGLDVSSLEVSFFESLGHAGGFLRLARQIPGWLEQPADLRSHRPQRRSSGDLE